MFESVGQNLRLIGFDTRTFPKDGPAKLQHKP
jgi:hypothetical protein